MRAMYKVILTTMLVMAFKCQQKCDSKYTSGYAISKNWFDQGMYQIQIDPLNVQYVTSVFGLNFLSDFDLTIQPVIQVAIDHQKFPTSHIGVQIFSGLGGWQKELLVVLPNSSPNATAQMLVVNDQSVKVQIQYSKTQKQLAIFLNDIQAFNQSQDNETIDFFATFFDQASTRTRIHVGQSINQYIDNSIQISNQVSYRQFAFNGNLNNNAFSAGNFIIYNRPFFLYQINEFSAMLPSNVNFPSANQINIGFSDEFLNYDPNNWMPDSDNVQYILDQQNTPNQRIFFNFGSQMPSKQSIHINLEYLVANSTYDLNFCYSFLNTTQSNETSQSLYQWPIRAFIMQQNYPYKVLTNVAEFQLVETPVACNPQLELKTLRGQDYVFGRDRVNFAQLVLELVTDFPNKNDYSYNNVTLWFNNLQLGASCQSPDLNPPVIKEEKQIIEVEGGWEAKAQRARRGLGIFFLILIIVLIFVIFFFCRMKRKQKKNKETIEKLQKDIKHLDSAISSQERQKLVQQSQNQNFQAAQEYQQPSDRELESQVRLQRRGEPSTQVEAPEPIQQRKPEVVQQKQPYQVEQRQEYQQPRREIQQEDEFQRNSEVSRSIDDDSKIDADISIADSERVGASEQLENDFRKLESKKKNPNDLSGILNRFNNPQSSVKKNGTDDSSIYVHEQDNTNVHGVQSNRMLELDVHNNQHDEEEDMDEGHE